MKPAASATMRTSDAAPKFPRQVQVRRDDRALFDQRRIEVLVDYSRSLRVQMWIIAAFIAALVAAGGGGHLAAALWLLLFVAVRETRAVALVKLAEARDAPAEPRLRQVMWWSLALGLVHGGAALFMVRLDLAYDALLSMVLMSLAAGAVSTTFTVVPAFNAYALAISVPTTALWVWQGGAVGWGVALLVALFSGVQIRFAQQNMRMFGESYRMRLENAALVRELDQEREQLAAARDAAVQADLAKSRFLASASHDLRQPLQSLELSIGALSRLTLPGDGPAIMRDTVASLAALRQMLEGLIEVSKFDAGSEVPDLRPVPLARLFVALQSDFRRAAEAKGLRLDVQPAGELVVTSDVTMLRRVLANLVDNAIKFTDVGGVTLRAQPVPGWVEVVVEDTGIGIAAPDLDRVFEDLVQLGNPERDRSRGHGLGLGIVRRLVRLLSAECQVQSEPGRGSRFLLRLPAGHCGDDAVLGETRRAEPALIARRVLVLDDDAGVRSAYRHALASLGCDVECCATLEAALQALPQHRPEVALVDYRLGGGVNGRQAIERLRDHQAGLAAVLVSADTSPELARELAPLHVPVLRKPVSEAMLAQAINEALHGAGHRPR